LVYECGQPVPWRLYMLSALESLELRPLNLENNPQPLATPDLPAEMFTEYSVGSHMEKVAVVRATVRSANLAVYVLM
jgi:hypothetical protein